MGRLPGGVFYSSYNYLSLNATYMLSLPLVSFLTEVIFYELGDHLTYRSIVI